MGAFAVRLYYKRLVFPLPLLAVPVFLKIRVNSLFVVGMYFLTAFEGGIVTLAGVQTRTDYWAHLSGLAAGIVLALRLRLQDQAMEEIHVEKALAILERGEGFAEAEQSLRLALERNPENETALLALARRKSRPLQTDEGRRLYQRIIRTNLDTVPERAAELFAEYFVIYRIPLDAASQYRLTELLQRSGRSELASRALELVADDPATPRRWAERVLFKLGRILEELRLPEAARFRYEQLCSRFPDFPRRSLVEDRIKRLTGG
jgi:tetratricopeptide (TPR) repeat protein